MQNDNNALEGIMTRNSDPRKNPEGYMDLTPYYAMHPDEYPKRGCLYYLDDKPVLIVSNDETNKHALNVSLVYAFEDERAPMLNTHVQIGERVVRCEKIASYRKSKIGGFICKLNDCDMERVEEALKISLGIKECVEHEIVCERPLAEEMLVLQTERSMYKKLYEQLLARITRDKVQGGI